MSSVRVADFTMLALSPSFIAAPEIAADKPLWVDLLRPSYTILGMMFQ
jgi:hypothetical protein